MGGKNSGGGGTSSTQVVIPPWIEGVLKPLLQGSASKLQAFQNQGWDVLQGNTPTTGVSLEELQNAAAAAGAGVPGAGAGAAPSGKPRVQR